MKKRKRYVEKISFPGGQEKQFAPIKYAPRIKEEQQTKPGSRDPG